MKKNQKLDLSVSKRKRAKRAPKDGVVVAVGEGKIDFPFPTVSAIVRRSLKRARPIVPSVDEPVPGSKQAIRLLPGFLGKLGIFTAIPKVDSDPRAAALVASAEGLQTLMAQRQFDVLVNERFGPLTAAVTWAQANMEARYQGAIASLGKQLTMLQEKYVQALPELVRGLAKKNPRVPAPQLIDHAIKLLDEELAQIFSVLRIYTDPFVQRRDGVFAQQLQAVTFLVEQCFMLFQTGDLENALKNGVVQPQIQTSAFNVGDVFLVRATGGGPATVPGAKGPVGAHALQVPFNQMDIIALTLPMFAHEFRHNVFSDVRGLEAEMVAVVRAAIADAARAGRLALSRPQIKLGDQTVATVELIIKLFADTIGEVDADIAGGVLLSGPAYLYNMLIGFPAMTVHGMKVRDANQLLRTSSVFSLTPTEDGSAALEFEAHPPDYIRAFIVAAALEEIGFKAEADECRALADLAVGTVPAVVSWSDEAGKLPLVIQIPVADVKAVAGVVAKAIIRTPLKSLSGRSTADLVSWNPRRQAKVEVLVQSLMAGKAEVPEGQGDFYATYVGAAATLAYWRMVSNKTDARKAAEQVNATALTMLEIVRGRFPKGK